MRRTSRYYFITQLILGLLISAAFAYEKNNTSGAEQAIAYYHQKLAFIYENGENLNDGGFDDALDQLVAELFEIDRFGPHILQRKWLKLNAYERLEFKNALRKSIQKKLVKWLGKNNFNSIPALHLDSKEISGRLTKLNYSFENGPRKNRFTIFMIKSTEGVWKISNVKNSKQSLLRYYYQICDDLLDDYSFQYMLGELLDEAYIVLEDFESSEVGGLPKNWTWKGKDDKKNKPYRVKQEDGNKFLAATDNGESVIIGKDVKWNLNKYPYVSFRWRGKKLPAGGDERYGRSVDSAAGIYFIYKKKIGLIPESVKYVWSTTLAVGSAMRRSGTGRPWMVVAESGEKNLGEWHTYVFNLKEAYRKTFGGNPPDRPIGIGILSDANSTQSQAYADYDDIRALKRANADSGIKQYLEAE